MKLPLRHNEFMSKWCTKNGASNCRATQFVGTTTGWCLFWQKRVHSWRRVCAEIKYFCDCLRFEWVVARTTRPTALHRAWKYGPLTAGQRRIKITNFIYFCKILMCYFAHRLPTICFVLLAWHTSRWPNKGIYRTLREDLLAQPLPQLRPSQITCHAGWLHLENVFFWGLIEAEGEAVNRRLTEPTNCWPNGMISPPQILAKNMSKL